MLLLASAIPFDAPEEIPRSFALNVVIGLLEHIRRSVS